MEASVPQDSGHGLLPYFLRITIDNKQLQIHIKAKYLGITLDEKLKCKDHINKKYEALSRLKQL